MTASKPVQSICTCGSLRRASRRLSRFYDVALAPIGIKLTQYSILAELERRRANGPVPMSVLAEAMVMDRSTVGHNLRPMERDQLLVLTVAPDDTRKRCVELTTRGMSTLRRAHTLWRRAEDRVDEVFGRKSVAALRAALLNIAHSRELDDESAG